MNLNNITAKGTEANAMKEHGRNGDTEMAHMTPGEQVIPLSVQTPRLMSVAAEEFANAGIPMERYRVQDSGASQNPNTGCKEYFGISSIASAVAGKALGSVLGGGDDGGGGGTTVNQAAPTNTLLNEPVEAFSRMNGLELAPNLPGVNPISAAPTSPMPTSMDSGSGSQGAGMQSPMMDTSVQPVGGSGNQNPDIMSLLSVLARNPQTGRQQFYDMGNRNPMRNPKTGEQEFFDPTAYAARYPDLQAAFGNDAGALLQHWNTFGQAEGRNSDPAPATPTNPAPSAPSAINPTVAPPQQQAPAPAPTPQQLSIMGLYGAQGASSIGTGGYTDPSNPLNRSVATVQANDGKFYHVMQNFNDSGITYQPVEGNVDPSSLSQLQNRQNSLGLPQNSTNLRLGNNNLGYTNVGIGTTFDSPNTPTLDPSLATQPAAPAAPTTPTPTAQPTSSLNSTTARQWSNDQASQLGRNFDYLGADEKAGNGLIATRRAEDQNSDKVSAWQKQKDDWLAGRIDYFTPYKEANTQKTQTETDPYAADDNDAGGDYGTSSTTSSSSGNSGSLSNTNVRTSSLTPERSPRFRSTRSESTLARNF